MMSLPRLSATDRNGFHKKVQPTVSDCIGDHLVDVFITEPIGTSKQDTDNQRRELEAVAKRSGWQGFRGCRHKRREGQGPTPRARYNDEGG
jgi:hypothetical protein